MSKIIPGTLFVVLFCFLGLFAGTALGTLFVPEGSGLAGPAIALGYGVVGLIIALVFGVGLARKLAYQQLRRALWLVSVFWFLSCGWLVYRYFAVKAEREKVVADRGPGRTTVQLATRTEPAPGFARTETDGQQELGVGIVSPNFSGLQAWYFYGSPQFDDLADHRSASDSVTFRKLGYQYDIATAPPWFVPEVAKMDYEMLMVRAVTLSRNWIEVVVNRDTGQTGWVDRHAVDFTDWTTFILEVYAVEIIDPESNPLRVRPLSHAGLVTDTVQGPLQPVAIKREWVQVVFDTGAGRQGSGWLRWRDSEGLLIRYSLLS